MNTKLLNMETEIKNTYYIKICTYIYKYIYI